MALVWVMDDSWLSWASFILAASPLPTSLPTFCCLLHLLPLMGLPAQSVHRPLKRLPDVELSQSEKTSAELISAVPAGFVSVAPHLWWKQWFFSRSHQMCVSSSVDLGTPCPLSKDASLELPCRRTQCPGLERHMLWGTVKGNLKGSIYTYSKNSLLLPSYIHCGRKVTYPYFK